MDKINNDTAYTEDDIEEDEETAPISETEAESQFDDFLTGAYGDVEICGMTMDAGHVLKECDNIAYREGFNNWTDSENIEIS